MIPIESWLKTVRARGRLPIGVEACVEFVPSSHSVATRVARLASSGGGYLVVGRTGLQPNRVGLRPGLHSLVADAAQMVSPNPIAEIAQHRSDSLWGAVVEVEGRDPVHGPVVVTTGQGNSDVAFDADGREVKGEALVRWRRRAGDFPDELGESGVVAFERVDVSRQRRLEKVLGMRFAGPNDLGRLGASVMDGEQLQLTLAGLAALVPEAGHHHRAFGIRFRRCLSARASAIPWTLNVWADGFEDAMSRTRDAFAGLGEGASPLIRELLVNAVAHRSYAPQDYDRPIEVEVFLDAVRVISPGGVLQRVGVNDDGSPVGVYHRNPRLVGMLAQLGFMTGHGRGVDLLKYGGALAGFGPATFSHEDDAVSVTLAVDREGLGVPGRPGPDVARRMTSEERDAQVLSLLRAHGSVSRPELQKAMGVSRPLVQQVLARLRGRGLVEMVGGKARSPKQRWRVVEG